MRPRHTHNPKPISRSRCSTTMICTFGLRKIRKRLCGGHSSRSQFSAPLRPPESRAWPRTPPNPAAVSASPLSGPRGNSGVQRHTGRLVLTQPGQSPCPWPAARRALAAGQPSTGATPSYRKVPAPWPRRSLYTASPLFRRNAGTSKSACSKLAIIALRMLSSTTTSAEAADAA